MHAPTNYKSFGNLKCLGMEDEVTTILFVLLIKYTEMQSLFKQQKQDD